MPLSFSASSRGEAVHLGGGLALGQLGDERRARLFERARARRRLRDELDDVVSELRLDGPADLAGRHREGRLLELRHHLAVRERAAAGRRVVLPLGSSVFSLASLAKSAPGTLARAATFSALALATASAFGAAVRLDRDEDVRGRDLLGNAEGVLAPLVLGAHVGVGGRRSWRARAPGRPAGT